MGDRVPPKDQSVKPKLQDYDTLNQFKFEKLKAGNAKGGQGGEKGAYVRLKGGTVTPRKEIKDRVKVCDRGNCLEVG